MFSFCHCLFTLYYIILFSIKKKVNSPVLIKSFFSRSISSSYTHISLVCFPLQQHFSKRYILLLSPVLLLEPSFKKITQYITIKFPLKTCQDTCMFKDIYKRITPFRIELTCVVEKGDCFWKHNGTSGVLVVFG